MGSEGGLAAGISAIANNSEVVAPDVRCVASPIDSVEVNL